MKLPEVYKALMELAAEMEDGRCTYWADNLRELAAEIPRRPPVARAPNRSRKMTDEMRDLIRAYHLKFPDKSQQKIADHFDINHGRVSEALAGFRE